MSTDLLVNLPIKIFADGADREGIIALYKKPYVQGLTTNPTLMKKVGISDYEAFAKSVLEVVTDKPISFEVFSDDFADMRRQALKIRDWQENVYVKIPITNTRRESALPLIRELAAEGVKLNVTALLTRAQVQGVAEALNPEVASVVSVFAGRIADTGVDPLPIMRDSLEAPAREREGRTPLGQRARGAQYLPGRRTAAATSSPRPHDILAKASKMGGMDLADLSLDTVHMFYQDALAAGFKL